MKWKRIVFWVALFVMANLPTCVFAQTVDWDAFHYSGYLDGSYNYLVQSNHFTSGVYDRLNDRNENGLTLHQAAFTLAYQPKQGFGALLNAFAGRDADTLFFPGWNPHYGSQTLELVVPQAYLQYVVHNFTFMGGIIDAEMGYESFNPVRDSNFSRSILDGYAEPGIMLGVRGIYAGNEKFKINAGINNGWAGFRDRGRSPGFELGGTYFFSPIFSLLLQALTSEERLTTAFASGPAGRRDMLELTASFKATDALTLVASGDYAYQTKALLANGGIGRAVWQGIAGYANYQLTEKWLTSLRGEVYADTYGYTTGVNQFWREVTLTLGYKPYKSLLVRAETRHDFSNISAFVNRGAPGTSNNQQSYAMEAVYQF